MKSVPLFIFAESKMCVEGTVNYIHLLLARKLNKVHRIARYTDCQLRVQLRMLHCIKKHLSI